MRNIIKVSFWISCVALFGLCSHPKQKEIIKINFDQLEKKDLIFSKDIFAEVSYTFLENDTSAMIGSNASLLIRGNKFYFLDPVGQQVCIFKDDGSFINEIGEVGRGPGEYISATDFWVDEEHGVVEILSYYNKKIYSYSLDGKFIGSRDGINAYSLVKENNGNYWLCKGITADEQIGNEQIYELDTQGRILRKYLPAEHTLHMGMPEKSLSRSYDHSILYFSHLDHKVYRITSDTILPFFEFNFGPLAYPEDLFGRSGTEVMQVMTQEEHLSVDNCLENSKYVYFFIIQTGVHFKYYHLLYHKDSGKILCQEVERNSWEYEFLRGAKALTEHNELIFLVNPENFNESLNRENTLFYQTGNEIRNADEANDIMVKLLIKWPI